MTTIAHMTEDELRQFVEDIVDKRIRSFGDRFEEPESADQYDHLTWDEVRALADRNRWTPPPGAKSSLELLREDRDR